MDWLLPALFLVALGLCAYCWWRYERAHPNLGWQVAPGESRWQRMLWLVSGPVLSALIAISISWLLRGSFPNGTGIIVAAGAATGGAFVMLTGLRRSHGEA
jgi:hypothetical protein